MTQNAGSALMVYMPTVASVLLSTTHWFIITTRVNRLLGKRQQMFKRLKCTDKLSKKATHVSDKLNDV